MQHENLLDDGIRDILDGNVPDKVGGDGYHVTVTLPKDFPAGAKPYSAAKNAAGIEADRVKTQNKNAAGMRADEARRGVRVETRAKETGDFARVAKAFNDFGADLGRAAQEAQDDAVSADWQPVSRNWADKLKDAVLGAAPPLVAYLAFWLWLWAGQIGQRPAVLCISVCAGIMGGRIARALRG